MAVMKTAILLCFVTCSYGIQFPFMNFGIGPFGRNPFSIPALSDPLLQQEEELPTENNIFDQLSDIPEINAINSKDIKTKKETKEKDGYKITTIKKNGPGFFSVMSEIHNDGNKTNGSNVDFSSAMMNTGNIAGNILGNAGNMLRLLGNEPNLKRKCGKKCAATEYCDPFYGKCRERLSEGSTCMMINQCSNDLRCVWGRCEKSNKGDPGTFCKRKDQCTGDACCVRQEDAFHAMCIPPLDEGAICGTKLTDLFMNGLSPERNQKDKECSPCKSDFKCGNVGHPKYKRCVKQSYVEQSEEIKKAIEKIEKSQEQGENETDDDKNNDGDDDKDDDKDDNGSSDKDKEIDQAGTVDDSESIPIKTEPKKNPQKKKHGSGKKTTSFH